jgi:hypothetical protein
MASSIKARRMSFSRAHVARRPPTPKAPPGGLSQGISYRVAPKGVSGGSLWFPLMAGGQGRGGGACPYPSWCPLWPLYKEEPFVLSKHPNLTMHLIAFWLALYALPIPHRISLMCGGSLVRRFSTYARCKATPLSFWELSPKRWSPRGL